MINKCGNSLKVKHLVSNQEKIGQYILSAPILIRVRVYDGSSWTTLPFGTPAFEAIGNFSAITLDADVGYSYEIYLQVWPAKDSNTLANGNGVHSISLRLEEPNIGGSSEESSDPFGKDPGKGLPRR